VVISDAAHCLGAAMRDHDLSGLAGHRLRTHGGRAEATVPFILSRPLDDAHRREAAGGELRSHDIFRFALNGI
jgi:phosphonoacetate hydrolase